MRIKQYISQAQTTGQGGSVHSLGGEKRSALNIPKGEELQWQAVGEVGKAITAIDRRLEEAKRVDEITNKKVQIGEEYSKLDSHMQSDEFLSTHKYDDYEEYRAEQEEQIREKVYGDLKDKKTIQAVDAMWGEASLKNKTRVKGLSRKMQVEEGIADTNANLTKLQATFLRESANANVRGADEAVQTAEAMIAGKVSAGYFNKEQGRQMLDEFRYNTTLTMWKQNIEQDPKWAMEQLNSPGVSNLTEDNRLILKKKAKDAYEARNQDIAIDKAYNDLLKKHGDNFRDAAKDVRNPNKYKKLSYDDRKDLASVFNNMDNNKKADLKFDELQRETKKKQIEEQKKVMTNKINNDLFKLDKDYPARLDYINNIDPMFGDLKRKELTRYEKDIKESKKKDPNAPKYNAEENKLREKILFETEDVTTEDIRNTGQNVDNREDLLKMYANATTKGEVQKGLEQRIKTYATDLIAEDDGPWWRFGYGLTEDEIKDIEDNYFSHMDTIREYFTENPKATYQDAQKFYDELIKPEIAKDVVNIAVNKPIIETPPIPTVTTKEQYNKIPSGALYINNGKQYRKK